jgi:hypothetical protein
MGPGKRAAILSTDYLFREIVDWQLAPILSHYRSANQNHRYYYPFFTATTEKIKGKSGLS